MHVNVKTVENDRKGGVVQSSVQFCLVYKGAGQDAKVSLKVTGIGLAHANGEEK